MWRSPFTRRAFIQGASLGFVAFRFCLASPCACLRPLRCWAFRPFRRARPRRHQALSCLQLHSIPAFQLLFSSENTRQQPRDHYSNADNYHLTYFAGLQGP